MESWLAAAGLDEASTDCGPEWPGRFVTIGTWWLLREIEVSTLTLNRIGFADTDGSALIGYIDLGATKKDVQGVGCRRSQACICAVKPEWRVICPACVLRHKVGERRHAGAVSEDLLFIDVVGDCVTKAAAVASMRQILEPEGSGEIAGHSMRRMGAQTMAAGGVDQAHIEWFGRWGSSAIKLYVEDARARAPQAARLAQVASCSALAEAPRAERVAPAALPLEDAPAPAPQAAPASFINSGP